MDASFDAWRKALARRIKRLREERGLTQEAFELGGVTSHTIQSIEYGQTDPKASTLFKVAAVFEMTVSELLDVEGE